MMKEADIKLLEVFLDGESSPPEMGEVRGRLAVEPALAEALRNLQAERSVRSALFTAIEPAPAEVERFIGDVRATIRHREGRRVRFVWIRRAGALAACVLIGFSLGYSLRWGDGEAVSRPQSNAMTSSEAVARVAIRDETGAVVAMQEFESLEQAQRFSEDLQRWQERQAELYSAQATVRSARF